MKVWSAQGGSKGDCGSMLRTAKNVHLPNCNWFLQVWDEELAVAAQAFSLQCQTSFSVSSVSVSGYNTVQRNLGNNDPRLPVLGLYTSAVERWVGRGLLFYDHERDSCDALDEQCDAYRQVCSDQIAKYQSNGHENLTSKL